MTNSENAWALRIQTQRDEGRGLREVVNQQAAQSQPLLAWAEPDPLYVDRLNRTERRGYYSPLVRGVPCWPTDLPLVEARLFWPKTALHLVARGDGGCVWTRIEEVDPEDKDTDCSRIEFPVYTLRDRQRFGLPDDTVIDDLIAIEYRQRGRLVVWRVMIGAEVQRHARGNHLAANVRQEFWLHQRAGWRQRLLFPFELSGERIYTDTG